LAVLEKAARLAIAAAIRAAKVTVTYTRSGGEQRTFTAGLGSMLLSQEGLDGQLVSVDSENRRDILAWPSDVDFVPQKGELVVVTLPNKDEVHFEVSSPGHLPHWEWSDEFQTAKRIHLREVEE